MAENVVTQAQYREEPLMRVMALHALAYCERLFYLEEVEEIRLADAAVYAGRRIHERRPEGDLPLTSFTLESESLGLKGKLDCTKREDGAWIPWELKKGHSAGDRGDGAWPSDALQVAAYAMLLEEHLGKEVPEGVIHYYADRRTVRLAMTASRRNRVLEAVEQARLLRQSLARPPVTSNERLCAKCSLAPVCLPEEERLAQLGGPASGPIPRYFPEKHEGYTVHVTTPGARISKEGDRLLVQDPDGKRQGIPVEEVQAVVLHGPAQISTQALHFCAYRTIPVHWISGGGHYVAGVSFGSGGIQRRIRQFSAMQDDVLRLELARKIAVAKISSQLGYVLRATRQSVDRRKAVQGSVTQIRRAVAAARGARNSGELRGYEGMAGRAYFAALPSLLGKEVDSRLVPDGRTRRPPEDPFNAALSFLYSLLYRDTVQAIMVVGLDPCYGVLHTPRSAAYPLALDLQELFRVPLVDIPLVGAINRKHFDVDADFISTGRQVWMSNAGKKKAIALYENRKEDRWKHPVLRYSLSYARTLELEVRLLEKEWSDAPGLFALSRLR